MKFMVTRPSLATRLKSAGNELTIIPNPWEERRTAWEIELDADSAQMIADYYNDIGKSIPGALQTFLDRAAGKEVR